MWYKDTKYILAVFLNTGVVPDVKRCGRPSLSRSSKNINRGKEREEMLI